MAHLSLFFVFVLRIVRLPGLDTALIVTPALAARRESGLAAVAGVMAGGIRRVAVGTGRIALLLKQPWHCDVRAHFIE